MSERPNKSSDLSSKLILAYVLRVRVTARCRGCTPCISMSLSWSLSPGKCAKPQSLWIKHGPCQHSHIQFKRPAALLGVWVAGDYFHLGARRWIVKMLVVLYVNEGLGFWFIFPGRGEAQKIWDFIQFGVCLRFYVFATIWQFRLYLDVVAWSPSLCPQLPHVLLSLSLPVTWSPWHPSYFWARVLVFGSLTLVLSLLITLSPG